MSILETVKKVLGNGDKLLCALTFSLTDNEKRVAIRVIGPNEKSPVTDVHPIVLMAMLASKETFDETLVALEAANLTDIEMSQVIYVEAHRGGANSVRSEIARLLKEREVAL